MPTHNWPPRRASLGDVSRRDVLTGALAGAAALATSGSVAGSERRGKVTSLAYVGCYTPNGLGIYLFRVEADGDLDPHQSLYDAESFSHQRVRNQPLLVGV